jgi:hypothetical protein
MLADPSLLKQSEQTSSKLDRQVFLNAARRGAASAVLSSPRDEPARSSLLEYAAFVLDQEARYCQQ